eukprot:CAMPEP_0118862986 /NCGR_PEP_ID=MMETSP1163-20130328/8010_1 /TAXON_ID=124430 /ORGANISM="Phaeomonas parva, Strain CCMP2877" /LENGTH=445 /DNA_ID=CAMNT_0006796947 /DNA_START=6 /DNA_END=1343 /DNA_ORIENTATION=+
MADKKAAKATSKAEEKAAKATPKAKPAAAKTTKMADKGASKPAKAAGKCATKADVARIFKIAFLFWFGSYVYTCTPHRWTSAERVVKETVWRLLYPVAVVFNPTGPIDGMMPSLDAKKLLPIESPPPVIYMKKDTPFQLAVDTLKAAWKNQDAIVIWKGFTDGHMDQWKNEKYAFKTLNNDKYDFLTNSSNYHFESLTIEEATPHMKDLYLGFSYSLLNNNKDTLLADINNMIHAYGPQITDLVPVNNSVHHAFLYKGNKYHTGMHQAPVSDWFFMISNAKTWRFVEPKYTPYLGAMTFDGVSTVCKFDYLGDDAGIPYTDVTVEAGDMMFFPAHWWHEVHNVDKQQHGIGFGFRPFDDAKDGILTSLLPLRGKQGIPVHRLAFVSGMFKSMVRKALLKVTYTANGESGLAGRKETLCNVVDQIQSYVPGWSWNSATGGPVNCHV